MKNSVNTLEQGLIIGSITTRLEEAGALKMQDYDVNYYTTAKQIISEYESKKDMESFSEFAERRLREIQRSKDEQRKEQQYTLYNVEVNEKGSLKGYVTGLIKFANQERLHEFKYRVNEEGSESNKLVSIDSSFRNPLAFELWHDIEDYLYKNYCINS